MVGLVTLDDGGLDAYAYVVKLCNGVEGGGDWKVGVLTGWTEIVVLHGLLWIGLFD